MTTIRVVDFETTGLPPDAAVCEIGYYDVYPGADPWLSKGHGWRVNPGQPILPEASAVHHLTDDDVRGYPPASEILPNLLLGADMFAAHNAAFEQQFFPGGDKPWICTLKAARRIWPDAPGHSNQTLRYWLKLSIFGDLAFPPHRSMPDAYVTACLLNALLAKATVEEMVQWTKEPSLLPRVTFGKHRGKAWADLPVDYLDWLVSKSDMDEDTKFTARHWLKTSAGKR